MASTHATLLVFGNWLKTRGNRDTWELALRAYLSLKKEGHYRATEATVQTRLSVLRRVFQMLNVVPSRGFVIKLSGMGLIVRSGRLWHGPAQVRDVLLQYVPAVVQEQAQNAFVAHCCAVMETAEQLFNAGMTVTAHAVVDGSRHGIQSVLVLGANGQLDRLPLSTQRRACAMVGYEVAHAFVPSSDLVGFATAMLHVSVTDGSDEGVAATAELRMNLQVPCKAMCGRPDDRCTRGCARVSVCVTTRRWMNACVHACACAR